MGKTYNIKLEDKAAFLNRLEKAGVNVNTSEIKDDKLNGIFSISFDNPEDLEKVKTILKQSTKINIIKELLRKIVREELAKNYDGIGIKPIHTTCNCGKPVQMVWNGNYHSADCSCGRNIRKKDGKMIIDFPDRLKKK